MLFFAISLVFVGLLFVFTEFFFPSIFLGALGVLVLLASLYFFYEVFSFSSLFILAVFGVFFSLFCTGFLASRLLKRKVFLPKEEAEKKTTFSSLIGKKGVVLCDLRPMGKIKIEGVVYSAVSESYILRGKEINVVGDKGEILKVEEEI